MIERLRRLARIAWVWRARAKEAFGLVDDMGPTISVLARKLARSIESETELKARVAELERQNRELRAEVHEHEDIERTQLAGGAS